MGCFNTNCCLTDLPIVDGEKVAFGLIAIPNKEPRFESQYPCGHFGFVTPIFTSLYNDYGSIIYDNISNRPLWNWLWNKISRRIIADEDLSKLDDQSKFDHLIHGDFKLATKCIQFFGNKDAISAGLVPDEKRIHIWMCHEWAFKAAAKSIKNPMIAEQAENFIMKGYVDPELSDKYFDIILNKKKKRENRTPEEMESILQYMSVSSKETYLIAGEQGTFTNWLSREVLCDPKEQLYEIIGEMKEPLLKAITQTATFTYGLNRIGRGILPPLFFGNGPQGYTSGNSVKWSALVAKKAKEREDRWKKGY